MYIVEPLAVMQIGARGFALRSDDSHTTFDEIEEFTKSMFKRVTEALRSSSSNNSSSATSAASSSQPASTEQLLVRLSKLQLCSLCDAMQALLADTASCMTAMAISRGAPSWRNSLS